MFVGLLFAISACFVWGLIFVIPQYLGEFSAMEIVMGRYFSYGVLSACLFFRKGFVRVRNYSPRVWMLACLFALLSTFVYYLGLVIGLRFATPTLAVLIVGMAPIVIALYGNWKEHEVSYRSLVIPCLWITFGLVLVNATEIDWSFSTHSFMQYMSGLLGIIIALLSWSWYAVHNSRFLKRNPQISAGEWATLIGVTTLFWTVLVGGTFSLGLKNEFDISKFFNFSPQLLRYVIAAIILGVICSWLGCFLWSRASVYLPISLMGPLLMFETLFGLLFVYFSQKQMPSVIELLGVACMVSGIAMSIYQFKKKQLTSH